MGNDINTIRRNEPVRLLGENIENTLLEQSGLNPEIQSIRNRGRIIPRLLLMLALATGCGQVDKTTPVAEPGPKVLPASSITTSPISPLSNAPGDTQIDDADDANNGNENAEPPEDPETSNLPLFGEVSVVYVDNGIDVHGNSPVATLLTVELYDEDDNLISTSSNSVDGVFKIEIDFTDSYPTRFVVSDKNGKGYEYINDDDELSEPIPDIPPM